MGAEILQLTNAGLMRESTVATHDHTGSIDFLRKGFPELEDHAAMEFRTGSQPHSGLQPGLSSRL